MRFHLQANITFEAETMPQAFAKLAGFLIAKACGDVEDNGTSLAYGSGFINVTPLPEKPRG